MILFKRLVLMLQFFTTIPLPIKLNADEKDFGKGLIFAPLVGVVLGVILAAAYYALSLLFPVQITAVIIIILYIVLTGGLHLDGLGDTFDGIFSNRPRERILEIMRDSRVGTNAVLAIVCVVLLNWCTIMQFDKNIVFKALIIMPVAGRIGSLVGAGVSTYARREAGLGKSFIDYCGLKEIGIGVFISGAIFFCVGGLNWLAILPLIAVTAVVLVKFLGKRIGGATGDILGAVCELNQTVFLIALYCFYK